MSQEPLCTLRRGMERYRNGCKNKMYCNRCRTDVLRHYRFLAGISPAERKGKRGHKGGNRLGDNPRRNVCRLAEGRGGVPPCKGCVGRSARLFARGGKVPGKHFLPHRRAERCVCRVFHRAELHSARFEGAYTDI